MASDFNLITDCSFVRLTTPLLNVLPTIDCGDNDLNDFFNNEAILYSKALLGKTYVWITNEDPQRVVGAFTVSNDSIKSKLLPKTAVNRINRPIDNNKRNRTYPAVLIGRLGVNKSYQGKHQHIGSQIVEFLKVWFADEDNKTGCRFLLVDAYNNEAVLNFYHYCGFKFLYPSDVEEKDFYGINSNEKLKTRMMYYDLK